MSNLQDEAVVERTKSLVQPILSSMGLELIDIEQMRGRGRALLRIFIDRDQGVTVKDCQEASTYLGRALDVDEVIPYPYTLEVSSPGLDRPLKKLEDYNRALGKLVRIKLLNANAGNWVVVGRISDVFHDRIVCKPAHGDDQEIPFENINNARLEVEW